MRDFKTDRRGLSRLNRFEYRGWMSIVFPVVVRDEEKAILLNYFPWQIILACRAISFHPLSPLIQTLV